MDSPSHVLLPSECYTGSEFDPITGIAGAFDGSAVFTACRDGIVRRYDPPLHSDTALLEEAAQ